MHEETELPVDPSSEEERAMLPFFLLYFFALHCCLSTGTELHATGR